MAYHQTLHSLLLNEVNRSGGRFSTVLVKDLVYVYATLITTTITDKPKCVAMKEAGLPVVTQINAPRASAPRVDVEGQVNVGASKPAIARFRVA